jgi:hypothetical protein
MPGGETAQSVFFRRDNAALCCLDLSGDVPRRRPGKKSPATLTWPSGKIEPI